MTQNFKSDFLQTMQARGYIHQCSDFEGLDAKLASGQVHSAYVGYDPTANSLHVGNLISIMMLGWFQRCGHKPVTLMGGGTSKVGDPSGKTETRKMLSDADINANIESIKNCFSQYINYANNQAIMVNNDDWLAGINYIDFLRDYGRHFSINRMLSFDSVKLRLEREQTLSFLEFNYMILQAYDFVELNKRYGTILQMGGSDQWGNIVNGVELGRRAENLDLYALTTPLLTTASGAKMGKTAQGAVWLNADKLSAYEYYQYWRNTEDADVERFLKLYTFLPLDEVAKLAKLQGAEINEAKKILALEVTTLCHGVEAAQQAAETARTVFEQGGVGADIPVFSVPAQQLEAGKALLDLLVEAGLSTSKGEARRLVQGGGVTVNDVKVADDKMLLTPANMNNGEAKLAAGKKKIVRVVVD